MSISITHIRPITAEETRPLRHKILRPHQSIKACAYPFDTAPGSYHIGCFIDERLVGVGSILSDAREGSSCSHSWRIRGMAVLDDVRGLGVGARILQALIDYAVSQGQPGEIWCNGRANVKGFYERFGFAQQGDIFDLPHIGPHVLLIKPLNQL